MSMSRDEGQKNCFLEKTIFIELDSLKQNTSMFSHGPRAYVFMPEGSMLQALIDTARAFHFRFLSSQMDDSLI